ncbi:MAG: ribonuclease J [Candidatus Portnoybacteria bacterium CG10_big_fil_rev_8_21_14_0_10_36_7]|uniref:Ribonuclease J n=1 Tax=Candidatus Portnoybacteria bacterium CG10_big_fil_rev_8_21_14_0_10_36_7 TaxID=1974812 RepID=A0A2M8KDI9_9BACT|nr:MAG: ribonuclease J [Candidatus Portnoybacteria bacterium CG10_big_fil_rev_8_21_14_0_10_36_7]
MTPQKTVKKEPTLNIIPLGGVEEIGRNMTIFEYDDQIIIVDMGLQFPEEDMPGIDYIIPNIACLEGKEKNILGVIITHGHYDHIGAIPHLMHRLGNPTIYTAALTRGIVLRRQEDFHGIPKLNIELITQDSQLTLGDFKVEFFHVNHNIPDGLGVVLHTPVGTVVHSGDFKFDHSPIGEKPADIARIAQIGAGGILCLLSDSTAAEKLGYTISEREVQDNLEIIFKESNKRIIIATFASLLSRVQAIINLAEKYDRKVAVDGYSMRMNVEIAKSLRYLKVTKHTLIKPSQIHEYPPEKAVILCTGAQGEGNAVLMRIVNKEHKNFKIEKDDSVVFSSSVVPGNERTVQSLKDNIYKQGARVYHYKLMDIHTSGHGQKEDLKMMLNLIKPKFLMPIHGNFYMLMLHGEIAQTTGMDEKNVILAENGQIISLSTDKVTIGNKKVPTGYVMVDGLGVGDVGSVVLRDRQMMSKDGMFVVIVTVDAQTGKVKNSPDIISRGFIYMRDNKELLMDTRKKVKEIVEGVTGGQHPINWSYVKENMRDKIGQFLFMRTNRRPMVLPVIIEV